MSCYHPITGWRSRNGGKLTLDHKQGMGIEMTVPCGNCIGCKIDTARDWSIRCYHEAQCHEHNSFITLTYSEENLPTDGSLDHRHFQEFIRALRKRLNKKIRFYMVGEYGDSTRRPHYHAIIFGHDFSADRYYWKTRGKTRYYRSPILEKSWWRGISDVSDFDYGAAAYVARYVTKKIKGADATSHYVNSDGVAIKPEYNRASLKPGLGYNWFLCFKNDIFPTDEVKVLQNGKTRTYPVPRYYTTQWEKFCPTGAKFIKERRVREAKEREEDNTLERRIVRERIARKKLTKRSLNDEI